MRYFLFVLLLFSVLATHGKIVIKGKIHHYDGKSIVYYNPTIEGIHTPYWKELQPDRNGVFRIEFENEGYGTTTVGFQSLQYRFFHDANSEIYFEIDQDKIPKPKRLPGIDVTDTYFIRDSIKRAATLVIRGDFENINTYYNKNIRTSYLTFRSVDGNYYSKLISETPSPNRAKVLLDSLVQREFTQISLLPVNIDLENSNHEKNEPEIKKFLMNEVRAFYGGVFLNAMFLKRKDQVLKLLKDSTAALDIYNREWEILIENFLVETKENLVPSPNSGDYNEFIESLNYTVPAYREYDFPQDPKPLDEEVVNRLFRYDTMFLTDPKAAYAYELAGLQRYLQDQLYYSPILLQAIYAIEEKHPKSANLTHFEPQINKLKSYIESSQKSFDKGRIIQANYNSLEALLKRFEGKNILIDIWATWCHPCIEDFRHKNKIQAFIDRQEIEVLYISIDRPEWEDRWKQCIKYNHLEGNHFRANRKFIVDMWNVLGDFQGAIPRYALIDKRGNIVVRTAARPGNNDELVQQISRLLADEKQK